MKTIETRLKGLGVSGKTIEDVFPNLDLGEIITQDEFNRPNDQIRKEDREKGYRKRAIERMIRDKIPFSANCNILHEMLEFFVQPVCICGEPMQFSSGSGSGAGMTFTFKCLKCEDEFEIVLANKALRYRPGKVNAAKVYGKLRPEDLRVHEGDLR